MRQMSVGVEGSGATVKDVLPGSGAAAGLWIVRKGSCDVEAMALALGLRSGDIFRWLNDFDLM